MLFAVRRLPFAAGVLARATVYNTIVIRESSASGGRQRGLNALDQARQHLLYVAGGFFQHFCLPGSEKPQVSGQQKKISKFICGTCRDVEELSEFPICRPSASLRNIGWNRCRSSSHLGTQTEPLRTRIRRGGAIDTQCEGVALSPDLQVSEVLHRSKPSGRFLRKRTLAYIPERRQRLVIASRTAL